MAKIKFSQKMRLIGLLIVTSFTTGAYIQKCKQESSEASQKQEINNKLKAPENLYFHNGLKQCIWTPNINAVKYEVYVDGKLVGETEIQAYKLNDLTRGTHTFEVKAIGAEGYKDSELSKVSFRIFDATIAEDVQDFYEFNLQSITKLINSKANTAYDYKDILFGYITDNGFEFCFMNGNSFDKVSINTKHVSNFKNFADDYKLIYDKSEVNIVEYSNIYSSSDELTNKILQSQFTNCFDKGRGDTYKTLFSAVTKDENNKYTINAVIQGDYSDYLYYYNVNISFTLSNDQDLSNITDETIKNLEITYAKNYEYKPAGRGLMKNYNFYPNGHSFYNNNEQSNIQ